MVDKTGSKRSVLARNLPLLSPKIIQFNVKDGYLYVGDYHTSSISERIPLPHAWLMKIPANGDMTKAKIILGNRHFMQQLEGKMALPGSATRMTAKDATFFEDQGIQMTDTPHSGPKLEISLR